MRFEFQAHHQPKGVSVWPWIPRMQFPWDQSETGTHLARLRKGQHLRTFMTRLLSCCTVFLLLSCITLTWARTVVVISIGGMRPDYVSQADQHKLKLPPRRY